MIIPKIGLGTYRLNHQQTYQAVRWALDLGYRHIDTATLYGNEQAVGKAIKDSGLDREQLFISTKISLKSIRKKQLKQAIEYSLKQLNIDYIDLILLHAPDADIKKTWLHFIDCYDAYKKMNLLTHIGVSNYQIQHLAQIIHSPLKLRVNQIEISPFLPRTALKNYCEQHNIQIVAHGSLTQGVLLNHPQLQKIAQQLNTTTSNLLLQWALQQNFKIIPSSTQYQHLKENITAVEWMTKRSMVSLLNDLNNGFAVHLQHI